MKLFIFLLFQLIKMITNYFMRREVKTNVITDTYEIHYALLPLKQYNQHDNEIHPFLSHHAKNCVCVNDDRISPLKLYNRLIRNNTPLIQWSKTVNEMRNKMDIVHPIPIDYAFIHYYKTCDSRSIRYYNHIISDESYFVCVGGICTFVLENKETKGQQQVTLCDGDAMIFKSRFMETFTFQLTFQTKTPHYCLVFRSVQTPRIFYTYFPSELVVRITNEEPISLQYRQIMIVATDQPTIFGIVQSENSATFSNIRFSDKNKNVSLLKSNLQKAIRRKLKDIAIRTTMELICTDNALQLLRRLTIISIEDVHINRYYSVIVWYYLSLTTSHYQLTEWDVSIIVSYVAMLCDIDVFFKYYDYAAPIHGMNTALQHNDICFSLYLRFQYGGFDGELELLTKMCHLLNNNDLVPCDRELEIIPYPTYSTPIMYLSCSIDFHCFHKMPERVMAKIKANYPETTLREKQIREYIWHFDSHLNARIEHVRPPLDVKIWEEIVKPQCEQYRFSMMRLWNLGDLIL